jgi:hypothetical protein
MESAHTGQVGKSDPRGPDLDARVDRTSATAGIVTSLRSLNLPSGYTDLFDDVATQMRWFYVIFDAFKSGGNPAAQLFAMQRTAKI